MYEDDFLEMRFEDLSGYPEDPADFDARDFDLPDDFFDHDDDESIQHPLYDQPGDDWL